MRFKKFYLQERYFKNVKDFMGDNYEVFGNPSRKEVNDILRNSIYSSVRFSFLTPSKMFATDGNILHEDLEKALKKKFIFKSYYETRTPNSLIVNEWEKFSKRKDKEKLLEKITFLIPKIKKVEPGFDYTGKATGFVINEGNENKELNNPFRLPSGSDKKFGVYAKNDKGNVVLVKFGDPNMEIKRDDPERGKAFRARHGCDNPGPKWKAKYWSCQMWSPGKSVSDVLDS